MEALDKNTLNQLYRFAISLTNDEDHAYDLLQSSIEKYLKKDLSNIEVPVAYLKRIIRNEFIDHTRRSRFQLDVEPSEIETINNRNALEQISLEGILIQQTEVAAVLSTMTPDERELLFLWAVEEYTFEEIAEMKHIPRGTLLSKIHRLKKRVQLQQNSDNVLSLSIKS